MDIKKRLGFALIAAVVLASIFALGFYLGVKTPAEGKISGILNTAPQIGTDREEVDFSEFWHAWNIAEGKFVDIDKVKRKEMVYGAIAGMIKSLGDPYTVFFNPEENKIFKSDIKGEFEGVGGGGKRKKKKKKSWGWGGPKKTPPRKRGGKGGGEKKKIFSFFVKFPFPT